MNNSAEQPELEEVSCNVCHQQVPHAESLAVEAQEYLYFFCGQGCYSTWQQLNGASLVKG